MSHQVLGFQLFNLNDYGIKLFPVFKENTLYFAKFEIVEKYADQDSHDEGSSQRSDKLLLTPSKDEKLLKNFPFTALFRDELVKINTSKQHLKKAISLFNVEYNYILILYLDSEQTTANLNKYFTSIGLGTEDALTIREFIDRKETELDEKLFKESSGTQRLQKRANPKHVKETPILSDHIKILEDDDKYKDVYYELIEQFDSEFLHSESASFEYDSTTQKNIV